MSTNVQSISSIKSGTCPHGMAPGACPICSGMGGGGSSRVGERPQKAGEMSYQRIENHEKNLLQHAEYILKFQQNMESLAQKMLAFSNRISNTFILKPFAYTITNIVVGATKSIAAILNIISTITDKLAQIKQKLVDIQDKLNAIFGEAKAFVEKKVSELISSIKSKLEGLFKIFKRNNTRDDDTKIDEDKKIFNLKTILHKIMRKKQDDTENKSGS